MNSNRHRPSISLLLILALAAGLPATAGTAPTTADPVAAIRAEIAALKADYEARIAALEARISTLESAPPAPPAPPAAAAPSAEEDLAALKAAALEAAGGAAAVAPPEVAGARPTAGRSDLNRTNPEISFTGDLLGIATLGGGSGAAGTAGTDTRDEFNAREFELDFQSALDPYSRTRWTLAFSPEGTVDVEEGYVTYNALPGGLGLNLGKFRQQFGVLNRQHAHALPQTDYPLVLRSFFGDEGLAETGVSARWLLPHPWATANEVTLEVTDGENEAFGGQNFQDFAGLAHLKNYWDLSAAAYFEWGLTATAGKSADGGGHQIYGTDFTVPLAAAGAGQVPRVHLAHRAAALGPRPSRGRRATRPGAATPTARG